VPPLGTGSLVILDLVATVRRPGLVDTGTGDSAVPSSHSPIRIFLTTGIGGDPWAITDSR
jgi:hypothetical protein